MKEKEDKKVTQTSRKETTQYGDKSQEKCQEKTQYTEL